MFSSGKGSEGDPISVFFCGRNQVLWVRIMRMFLCLLSGLMPFWGPGKNNNIKSRGSGGVDCRGYGVSCELC